jgi:hypothetical protein
MTAQQIRDAVAAGEYGKAAECFDSYARSLPLDERSLAELEELLRWVRITVRCADAHAQARLQCLRDEAHALAIYGR